MIWPFLHALLWVRMRKGKEDIARISERTGHATRLRPEGKLAWVHAASVGEAQSALIFIEKLLADFPQIHILVTSGTKTSAEMLTDKLPPRAFHQYIPVDHPLWTERFLRHWHPDTAFWMESELWPNILHGVKKRSIPAALINARLSPRSASRWRLAAPFAQKILSSFDVILCQTAKDAHFFNMLGHQDTHISDNLKYSAQPLPCDEDELQRIKEKIGNRQLWLYASSHDGEEALAAQVHGKLQNTLEKPITIIVPRHPQRGEEIQTTLNREFPNLRVTRRTSNAAKNALPDDQTDIYIADTLGELGLFYRLAPICIVGRCFSNDGGGGHNPLEPALLGCGVLYGPNVQNLQEIYDEMERAQAAIHVQTKDELYTQVNDLLSKPARLKALQQFGQKFAKSKTGVINTVFNALPPVIKNKLCA